MQTGPDFSENPGPAAHAPQDAWRKDLILGEQRELQRRTGEITELAAIALQMDDPQAIEEVLREAGDLQRDLEGQRRDPEDRKPAAPRGSAPGEKPDTRNAILTILAGAGGQDSQDWAERLAGMYAAWAATRRRPAEWLSVQHGDRGGHRSATIRIGGPDAPAALQSEHGVHRISHLSPRDRSGRRHTSFASVEVIPEQPEHQETAPNPKDLRTKTFRASGPGGQNVQKVSTAVRITHAPTGVTATCQSERSQAQNMAHAMTLLQSRLAARQAEEAASEKSALRGERQTASFGSRIRSYVFLPSRLVRDHRTGHTHPDPDAVLAGDLDGFIQAYQAYQAHPA